MPTVDRSVQKLIINRLTQAEYDAAVQAGTINENELYMVTDTTYPTTTEVTEEINRKIQIVDSVPSSPISGTIYLIRE